MRVTLEKEGGFAGGVSQPPRTVDCAGLPRALTSELDGLLAEVQAAKPIESAAASKFRDAMTFTISFEKDGKTSVVRQSESGMSEAFSKLLTWIERHAQ